MLSPLDLLFADAFLAAIAFNNVAIADNAKQAEPGKPSAGHVRIFQWSNPAQGWKMKGDTIMTEHIGDTHGEHSAAKPSISMDSSGALVTIGSPGCPRQTGHVRSFRWNPSNSKWDEMGLAIEGAKANDLAGASVQVVNGMNGVFVAIGEPGNGNGHVRVFALSDVLTPFPPGPPPDVLSASVKKLASAVRKLQKSDVAAAQARKCTNDAGEPTYCKSIEDLKAANAAATAEEAAHAAEVDGLHALEHAATRLSVFNFGDKAKQFWLEPGKPESLLEWTDKGTSMQLLGETFETPDRSQQAAHTSLKPAWPQPRNPRNPHNPRTPRPLRFAPCAVVQALRHPGRQHLRLERDGQKVAVRHPGGVAGRPGADRASAG